MKDESRPALEAPHPNGAHPTATSPAMRSVQGNVAVKCPNCKELLVSKDWEKNLRVCLRCNYHFRLTAAERVDLLLDPGTFREFANDLPLADPLHFSSRSLSYASDLKSKRESTGLDESVVVGYGQIEELPLILSIMDFRFMGGSMGSIAGEKITQAIERATKERIPLVVCSASGGARMQEGLISLMQMAKTSVALGRLAEAGVPYISLLTDPTTGGVLASFAYLGDVILAEPGALIGFSGPRVIEQFLHMRLPKDTNTSEFTLAHGMIDTIVHRRVLRATLARLLRLYSAAERTSTSSHAS